MELNRKLTHVLDNVIPDYINDYYPLFVIFMTKYFEYLENTSTGVQHTIQNIQLNRDIDTTANDLAIQFLNTYVPGLPSTTAADRTIVVKYFKEFFKNKGNEKSFKFFFRAFFNDDAQVSYPRDVLFKTSDGNWYIQKTLRSTKVSGDPYRLANSYVTGNTSKASAVIDKVIGVSGVGDNVFDFVLQNSTIRGTFTSGETITGIAYDFVNDTTSQVTLTTMAPVVSAAGKYLDTKSQLSNNQVLQDSYYYQQFSYIVKSGVQAERWMDYVLNHLHPTGTKLFNEYVAKEEPENQNSSFSQTTQVETTVRIPIIKSFYNVPTFSFDRTADLETGTSQTLLATTTGFAVVSYTSIGAIAYDTNFDYPGEHITWALQKISDIVTSTTEIVRFDGAMFDKLRPSIDIDDQIIAWPYDVNSSLVTTRYTVLSSVTVSNTVLSSITSGTLTYKIDASTFNATSVGSLIFLVTYVKNSKGNNAGEEDDTISIRISSNSAIVTYFDNEVQRNYNRICLNNTLNQNEAVYYHSSNSVRGYYPISGSVSADANSSTLTASGGQFLTQLNIGDWIYVDDTTVPYTITAIADNNTATISPIPTTNIGGVLGGVLYKAVISGIPISSQIVIAGNEGRYIFEPYNGQRGLTYDRFAMRIELDQQLQRNTSLTETFNTADITSLGLIASWSSYSTSVSTNSFTSNTSTAYVFNSNVFVYNGDTSQSRFIRTVPFTNCGRLDMTVSYVVGDQYNGGEVPDAGEDLVAQISYDGTTWFNIVNLWTGSTSNAWIYGSTSVTGKAWTTVGSTTVNGSGTLFSTDLRAGDRILIGTSTATTAYTITNIISNNQLAVTPAVVDLFRSSVAITGTVYGPDNTSVGVTASRLYGSGTTFTLLNRDNSIALGTSTGTSYTIINIIDDNTIDVSPRVVGSYTSGTTAYLLNSGVNYYKILPVSEQFRTTSVTVYNGPETSVTLRIQQISATGPNNDVYAVENLKVDSFRYQATTGVVNIHVTVSSGTTLYVNDTDYIDITTIGTL